MKNIHIIVAVNPQGVIAVEGQIPWRKKVDLQRFKATTMGGTLIMGRKTWESIGKRFLPGRRTLVLSRTVQPKVVTATSFEEALLKAQDRTWVNGLWAEVEWPSEKIWVAGGAEVYEQALKVAESIDLTIVTDFKVTDPTEPNVTRLDSFVEQFPGFEIVESTPVPEDPSLLHCRYIRT